MPNEPSMEEILSSIKRIIAEEDGAAPRPPRRAAAAAPAPAPVDLDEDDDEEEDQILELTDALPGDDAAAAGRQKEPTMTASDDDDARDEPVAAAPAAAAPRQARGETRGQRARPAPAVAAAPDVPPVMSDMSAQAARDSLVNLSRLLVRPEDGPSNTLEDLVREMLRPMLKEWLDANLPGMVETMVKREIDRITGRV